MGRSLFVKKNSFTFTMDYGSYEVHDKKFRHLLEYAPQNVIFQILLHIPHEDLEAFCSINKRVREVCREHNVKVEYYKKNPIAVVDSLKEAKAYLKKNPSGFLHMGIMYYPKKEDIKAIGDRVVYLDLANEEDWRKFNIKDFPNIKERTLIGKKTEIYRDGELVKKITLRRGGKKSEEEFYENGKLVKKIKFHRDGSKWREYNYKDGKEHGKQYEWHEGQLVLEYNYKDGKQDGMQYEWTDGELIYEAEFKDGERLYEK